MSHEITYVVPAYRCQLTLEKCLSSLPEGREIIVVGRGESDFILSQLQKFPQALYVEAKIPGAAHARNLGASFARGSHVAFLDADTWLSSDFSEPDNFAEYDITLFSIQMEVITDSSLSRFMRDRKSVVNKMQHQLVLKNFLLFADTAFMIVERNFFSKSGGFREDLLRFEDREFGYRHQIAGARIRYELIHTIVKGIDEGTCDLVRKKIKDIFYQARIIFTEYHAYRKHVPDASLWMKFRVELDIFRTTKPSRWVVFGWLALEFPLMAILKAFYSCQSLRGAAANSAKPARGVCLISIGPNNFMKSFEGE